MKYITIILHSISQRHFMNLLPQLFSPLQFKKNSNLKSEKEFKKLLYMVMQNLMQYSTKLEDIYI